MLEAMACAVPIVATRAGGIPEAITDGASGLLVSPQDEGALAAAIVRLLKDAELRGRLGAAGRQRVVDEFSIEKMVQDTLRVYEERVLST
jgi:glycosyltransferase involved in cell wall biosynthesis